MTISAALPSGSTHDHASGLLHVAGLSKRYGEQRALTDISFSVDAGEVLGLIRAQRRRKTALLETSPACSRPTPVLFAGAEPLSRCGGAANSCSISRTGCVHGRISTSQRVCRCVLHGGLWPAGELRGRDRGRARARSGPAQAGPCVVEGLRPPADAGARVAHSPSVAADGRAVRRLRSAADPRDHGRAP